MKINISKMQDGLTEWSTECNPADIELDPMQFNQPLSVDLKAEKRSGKVELSIDIHASGDFLCSRCGEELNTKIKGSSSVLFMQREQPLPDEMQGDEVRSFLPGEIELDISTDVRDAVMISMPMRMLCDDDCKGLCPSCGVNLNNESCDCKE